MKTLLLTFVFFAGIFTFVGCATPEERQRRDAERRREDAREEAEERKRDQEDARRDREDDRRYRHGYGWGRRYWY